MMRKGLESSHRKTGSELSVDVGKGFLSVNHRKQRGSGPMKISIRSQNELMENVSRPKGFFSQEIGNTRRRETSGAPYTPVQRKNWPSRWHDRTSIDLEVAIGFKKAR